jgi:hypothetical protein
MSLIFKSKYIVLFFTLLSVSATAQSNVIDSVLYVFPNKSKLCRVSGKYGILTRKEEAQKDFSKLKWDKISESKYFPDMYLVDSSVHRGLIRKIDGKIITPPKWRFIDTFSYNIAIVVRVLENTNTIQMAMIDKNGNEIMPPTCLIKRLKNSNYLVSNEANGHLYVLDKTGKIIREHLGYKVITYQNQRTGIDFMGFENQSFLAEGNNKTLWILNTDGSKDSLNYRICNENHLSNKEFRYIYLQKKSNEVNFNQNAPSDEYMLLHTQTGRKYFFSYISFTRDNKNIFTQNRLEGVLTDTGIVINGYVGIRSFSDGRFGAIDRDSNLVLFTNSFNPLFRMNKIKDIRILKDGFLAFANFF